MIYLDIKGRKIPALGYGTYQLKEDTARTGVLKALETGYRHIDTAQMYKNEEGIGKAIAESGIKREDIFLTTKVWMDRVTDGDLQKSADESLARLNMDYVDLLLIHWPNTSVPFSEQLKALGAVKAAGKAKMIGISNFTVAQIKEVVETIGADVVTNQVEYHPYLSQKPILDTLRAHKMFLTAYSPLAQGRVRDDAVLKAVGDKHGKTQGQIALRWLVQQEDVAAIPKAGSEKHIRENFEIFDFALDADDLQKIKALVRPDGRIVNPDFAPEWDKAA